MGTAHPQAGARQTSFAAVLETAALNEQELAEYCRERGLYPAQIQQWREACAQANDWSAARTSACRKPAETMRNGSANWRRNCVTREKSLAETAALLVLSKKLKAIWGGRGKMTSGPDRKEILELVDEAEQSGARHSRIAELLGLHARTLRRWAGGGRGRARGIVVRQRSVHVR